MATSDKTHSCRRRRFQSDREPWRWEEPVSRRKVFSLLMRLLSGDSDHGGRRQLLCVRCYAFTDYLYLLVFKVMER